MVLAVESIGTLILNVSLIGSGIVFALIGLILAFSRNVTKNSDHWSIMFCALSWFIALVVPDIWFSSLIFSLGSFGLVLAFMPLYDKINDSNVVVIALIFGLLNLFLILGGNMFLNANTLNDNYDNWYNVVVDGFNTQNNNLEQAVPAYRLCAPNSLIQGNVSCAPDALQGSFLADIYVPIASIFAIGTYGAKVMSFVGILVLAPTTLSFALGQSSNIYHYNSVIILLMGMFITFWQMIVFYKLIRLIINKYGMGK